MHDVRELWDAAHSGASTSHGHRAKSARAELARTRRILLGAAPETRRARPSSAALGARSVNRPRRRLQRKPRARALRQSGLAAVGPRRQGSKARQRPISSTSCARKPSLTSHLRQIVKAWRDPESQPASAKFRNLGKSGSPSWTQLRIRREDAEAASRCCQGRSRVRTA